MSSLVQTLPDGAILLNFPAVDEVLYVRKFFENTIAAFDLPGLTNGNINGPPRIIGAHPLAVIQVEGASKLPLIGVEQTHTKPDVITHGVHPSQGVAVSAEWLDLLDDTPLDERMFSKKAISGVREILSARETEGKKLFVYTNSLQKDTGVQISIWTADSEELRVLRKVYESMLLEFYRAINQQRKIHAKPYDLEPSLYNIDGGEILYGAEFHIPFTMRNLNYLIDVGLEEIKTVDIGVFNTLSKIFIRPLGSEEGIYFSSSGAIKTGTKEEVTAEET